MDEVPLLSPRKTRKTRKKYQRREWPLNISKAYRIILPEEVDFLPFAFCIFSVYSVFSVVKIFVWWFQA